MRMAKQLITLLVDCLKRDEYNMNKELHVNDRDVYYFMTLAQSRSVWFVISCHPKHKKANPKVVLCIVCKHKKSQVYFRRGKSTDKDDIVFHEINSLAGHLGENVYNVLPAFYVLTGSDYTSTYLAEQKLHVLKELLLVQKHANKLLESLNGPSADIAEVTEFFLQVIYNQSRK